MNINNGFLEILSSKEKMENGRTYHLLEALDVHGKITMQKAEQVNILTDVAPVWFAHGNGFIFVENGAFIKVHLIWDLNFDNLIRAPLYSQYSEINISENVIDIKKYHSFFDSFNRDSPELDERYRPIDKLSKGNDVLFPLENIENDIIILQNIIDNPFLIILGQYSGYFHENRKQFIVDSYNSLPAKDKDLVDRHRVFVKKSLEECREIFNEKPDFYMSTYDYTMLEDTRLTAKDLKSIFEEALENKLDLYLWNNVY